MDAIKSRTCSRLSIKTEIDKFRDKDITGKELDKNRRFKRKRVTDKNLQELTAKDIEVLAIKSKMTSGFQMAPQIIKRTLVNRNMR